MEQWADGAPSVEGLADVVAQAEAQRFVRHRGFRIRIVRLRGTRAVVVRDGGDDSVGDVGGLGVAQHLGLRPGVHDQFAVLVQGQILDRGRPVVLRRQQEAEVQSIEVPDYVAPSQISKKKTVTDEANYKQKKPKKRR